MSHYSAGGAAKVAGQCRWVVRFLAKPDIKGKCLSNKIISAAVHDLRRAPSGFVVIPGNGGLSINATTRRVIDDLYTLYSRRASKSHGKFSDDETNFPTQRYLREYLAGGSIEFEILTDRMMLTLRVEAGKKSAAAGGHVFFAHFERDAQHYLLVAIISDRLGAILTKTFDVQDVNHLYMEDFRFAGRINMTDWINGGERYIGFLKGKGDVSDYFKDFLGCNLAIQDRLDTAQLVDALKSFASDENMPPDERSEFLARAKSICERAALAGEELELEALANELMPKDPQSLLVRLVHPELKLNDRFVPDRRALRSLVKFRGKTSLWSVEFDREALIAGKIICNPDADSLTINDLPQELSAQLISEIRADDPR